MIASHQPNLCDSDLKAVYHGSSKFSTNYRNSGAGAALCGCHTLVRKNGLGDLQKGERYVIVSLPLNSYILIKEQVCKYGLHYILGTTQHYHAGSRVLL